MEVEAAEADDGPAWGSLLSVSLLRGRGETVIPEKACEIARDDAGSLGEFLMMTDPRVSPLSELEDSELDSESESSEDESCFSPFPVGDPEDGD